MEQGADHDDHINIPEMLSHLILCNHDIGDDIGKGTIITDRTCENEGHIVFDAFIHDALFDHSLFNGIFDRARTNHLTDGVYVVFVTTACKGARIQVHTKRGAKEVVRYHGWRGHFPQREHRHTLPG